MASSGSPRAASMLAWAHASSQAPRPGRSGDSSQGDAAPMPSKIPPRTRVAPHDRPSTAVAPRRATPPPTTASTTTRRVTRATCTASLARAAAPSTTLTTATRPRASASPWRLPDQTRDQRRRAGRAQQTAHAERPFEDADLETSPAQRPLGGDQQDADAGGSGCHRPGTRVGGKPCRRIAPGQEARGDRGQPCDDEDRRGETRRHPRGAHHATSAGDACDGQACGDGADEGAGRAAGREPLTLPRRPQRRHHDGQSPTQSARQGPPPPRRDEREDQAEQREHPSARLRSAIHPDRHRAHVRHGRQRKEAAPPGDDRACTRRGEGGGWRAGLDHRAGRYGGMPSHPRKVTTGAGSGGYPTGYRTSPGAPPSAVVLLRHGGIAPADPRARHMARRARSSWPASGSPWRCWARLRRCMVAVALARTGSGFPAQLPLLESSAIAWSAGMVLALGCALGALGRDREQGRVGARPGTRSEHQRLRARARRGAGAAARGHGGRRDAGRRDCCDLGDAPRAGCGARRARPASFTRWPSQRRSARWPWPRSAGAGATGGALALLAVLALPELLSPWTATPLLPRGWHELTSIPAALAAVRAGVMAPAATGAAHGARARWPDRGRGAVARGRRSARSPCPRTRRADDHPGGRRRAPRPADAARAFRCPGAPAFTRWWGRPPTAGPCCSS